MGTKVIVEEAFPYTSEYVGMAGDGVTPVYDRAIGSAAYREIWKTFFSDGISDEKKDFSLTLLGGFGISIGRGRYFADGVTGVVNRETVLQIEAPPSDVDRTDLVVIQNHYIDRRTYICVKKGSVPPAGKLTLERNDEIYEIGLYTIRVRVNAASLQTGDITDLRSDRAWCGKLMTSDAAGLVPVIDGLTASTSGLPGLSSTVTGLSTSLTGLSSTVNNYVLPCVEKVYASNPVKEKVADYRTAGTYVFTVPAKVYCVDAFVMGGGGGAPWATSPQGTDCAGGGAGYVKNVIKMAVSPGQQISVVVGAGGAAGNSSVMDASNGGASSFNGITAAGGQAGTWRTGILGNEYGGRPGAGSSAGGAVGGGGYMYATSMTSSALQYEYVLGQGYGAINANDPGRTYGRGGKMGSAAAPVCDEDVGSGGDGGRIGSGTIQGTAGKAGCVIIYAYISTEALRK